MHPVHLLELLVLLEPQMMQEIEKWQCVSIKDFSKVNLIKVTRVDVCFESTNLLIELLSIQTSIRNQ